MGMLQDRWAFGYNSGGKSVESHPEPGISRNLVGARERLHLCLWCERAWIIAAIAVKSPAIAAIQLATASPPFGVTSGWDEACLAALFSIAK